MYHFNGFPSLLEMTPSLLEMTKYTIWNATGHIQEMTMKMKYIAHLMRFVVWSIQLIEENIMIYTYPFLTRRNISGFTFFVLQQQQNQWRIFGPSKCI